MDSLAMPTALANAGAPSSIGDYNDDSDDLIESMHRAGRGRTLAMLFLVPGLFGMVLIQAQNHA
jgi:hypothetical protein